MASVRRVAYVANVVASEMGGCRGWDVLAHEEQCGARGGKRVAGVVSAALARGIACS